MADRTDWELLARFLAGEASAAERAQVERWAGESAEHRTMLNQLTRRWALARADRPRDVDAAWSRVAERLGEARAGNTSVVLPFALQPARPSLVRHLLPLAAVLVVALGIGLLWRARGARDDGSLGTAVTAATTTTSTGVGERRTIDLADGSHVTLGAASRLRVGGSFGSGARDVYLEGRALFQVRHDAARAFVVHAAGTAAQDLGTEFEVVAYPGDSLVRVVVKEGAVSVRSEARGADSAAVLHDNDVALLSGVRLPSVTHLQNVERLLSWTNGDIVFENARMSDVAAELSRWFGVDVQFADPSLRQLHVSAPFTTTQRVDDVVGVIAKTLQLHVERRGKVVTFAKGSA